MKREAWSDGYGRGNGVSFPAPLVLLLCAIGFLLSACLSPGDAAPVVKIGLIAPFEGLGRPFGYAVLPAVKAAIAEVNARGDLGPYRVALVALDGNLDPVATAAQAEALARDPDVIAVLGPWDSTPAQAAIPVLAHNGIPALIVAPAADLPAGLRSLCPAPERITTAQKGALPVANLFLPDTDAAAAADDLTDDYATGDRRAWVGGPDVFRPWLITRAGAASEGTRALACAPEGMPPPTPGDDTSLAHAAALADFGARVLLEAFAADIAAHGRPTQQGVTDALAAQPFSTGLVWYRIEDGKWTAVH